MAQAGARVALLLGAGPNVGDSVAQAFLEDGYKVVTVSRSAKKDQAGDANRANISADLSDPKSIVDVFRETESKFGLPDVVVYNAAKTSINPKGDPLALAVADFINDLEINTISAYAAAQEAAKAFGQISGPASRTFIYTGNVLSTDVLDGLNSLGVGKSASAHFIHSAAAAYADRGYKFYYCDERKPDGSAAYHDIDGPAHAKHYLQLSQTEKQGPWHQTFVKDKGYQKF